MKIFHCESDHTCIWMSFAQVVVGHSKPHLRPLGSIDGEFDTHSGSQSGLMPGVWHQEWSYSPLECSIAPWKRKHVKHFRDETLVLLEIIVLLSLINNWIARGSLRMGPLRSGPRCGTDGLGQKTHPISPTPLIWPQRPPSSDSSLQFNINKWPIQTYFPR